MDIEKPSIKNEKLIITLDEVKKQNDLVNKILTLCFIIKNGEVLLGMKKRGFGAGQWNGFGGKLKEGETIEDATKREIKEEVNLKVNNIQKVGVLDFYFSTGSKNIHQVHIYVCNDYIGDIMETEEMEPRWFKINELPLKNMWQADIAWLPIVLNNKKVKGEFLYDKPSTPEHTGKVIEYKLEEYD